MPVERGVFGLSSVSGSNSPGRAAIAYRAIGCVLQTLPGSPFAAEARLRIHSRHDRVAGQASGRIVDLMALFVALEIVLLVVYWRRTGRGVPPLPLLLNIGAGGSLMLALRAVLVQSGTLAVAAWLLAALVFHVADLAQRWRR